MHDNCLREVARDWATSEYIELCKGKGGKGQVRCNVTSIALMHSFLDWVFACLLQSFERFPEFLSSYFSQSVVTVCASVGNQHHFL